MYKKYVQLANICGLNRETQTYTEDTHTFAQKCIKYVLKTIQETDNINCHKE